MEAILNRRSFIKRFAAAAVAGVAGGATARAVPTAVEEDPFNPEGTKWFLQPTAGDYEPRLVFADDRTAWMVKPGTTDRWEVTQF